MGPRFPDESSIEDLTKTNPKGILDPGEPNRDYTEV